MLITKLVADHIKQVYEGDNWTSVSIADTIIDVNWQQAQKKNGSFFKYNCFFVTSHIFLEWNFNAKT